MATVVLQTVGAAIGGAVGGPVGAAVGRAVGALAGNAIDQKLFSKDQVIEGARLDGTRILSSSEGAAIPHVYGRNRISGQIIWATRFEETSYQTSGGGKGTGSAASTRNYSYFANFAVGICNGPVSCLRRVWADGREIDLTKIEYRFYNGDEDQLPDPLIEAKQGADNTPAYRGLAYIVFETFPLAEYGNRIPQLSFEIVRSIGKLEQDIRSITIIPGSTEYGYSPSFISYGGGETTFNAQNRHTNIALTDWQASIDELQAICPNLESVSLVIAWFGDDLRAGECRIRPGVTSRFNGPWRVADKSRAQAHQISQIDGRGAYGGTPSDDSIIAAIHDLKERGLKVVIYPFIMMDITSDNSLQNPYGGESQPAYPWRGEITCFPAPLHEATADKTEAARNQLEVFTNRSDGSYRELILHYANLCKNLGGVDGFLIGSEMRGVTRVRDETGAFPFVETLVELASEVRQILGPDCDITYGADWSEYFGWQPPDGSGDVLFNLDPLWASPDISSIGIDNYMPLADWRNAGDPSAEEVNSIHDIEYLKSNIAKGEGYDWYYASASDRENATRTPITDGEGEPWIYRYKDLKSWWSNEHYNRIGGVRSEAPTAWQPRSKPFVFTELGCPAIDKGANQPNVFFDPKSVQSAIPYFSAGGRDDLIQRRFLEAHYDYWNEPENNPVSDIYDSAMVRVDAITPWAWDARPFPWFPQNLEVWSDGENWHRGHWLNGRMGACSLQDLIRQVLADFDYTDIEIKVDGYLDGYVIPAQTSARSALEPLLGLFNIMVLEEEGKIVFREHGKSPSHQLTYDELVQEDDDPAIGTRREAELELPAEAQINHMSVFNAYDQTATKSRHINGASDRQISISLSAVMDGELAQHLAERQLRDAWHSRNERRIAVSNANLAITIGDIITFENDKEKWLVESVETGERNDLILRSVENNAITFLDQGIRHQAISQTLVFGKPQAYLLDLPLLKSSDANKNLSHIAVVAKPWAGRYSVFASPFEDGFEFRTEISRQATVGTILNTLEPKTSALWDRTGFIEISLTSGNLQSLNEAHVLNGANLALLQTDDEYEIIQFRDAKLQENGTWRLSNLLRGQFGTDSNPRVQITAGAKFILLNEAIFSVELETNEIGQNQNWRIGPSRDGFATDTYVHVEHANIARSAIMLSPVHLRSMRDGDDVQFSWIRRGRINADTWDNAEIVLDAPTERYGVTILDQNKNTKREVETSQPQYDYTLEQRLEDFGLAHPSFEIRVAQIGENGLSGAATSLFYSKP